MQQWRGSKKTRKDHSTVLSTHTICTTCTSKHFLTFGLIQFIRCYNSTFLMTNVCPDWYASTTSPFPPFPNRATSRLIILRTLLLKAPSVNMGTVYRQSMALFINQDHYTHTNHIKYSTTHTHSWTVVHYT